MTMPPDYLHPLIAIEALDDLKTAALKSILDADLELLRIFAGVESLEGMTENKALDLMSRLGEDAYDYLSIPEVERIWDMDHPAFLNEDTSKNIPLAYRIDDWRNHEESLKIDLGTPYPMVFVSDDREMRERMLRVAMVGVLRQANDTTSDGRTLVQGYVVSKEKPDFQLGGNLVVFGQDYDVTVEALNNFSAELEARANGEEWNPAMGVHNVVIIKDAGNFFSEDPGLEWEEAALIEKITRLSNGNIGSHVFLTMSVEDYLGQLERVEGVAIHAVPIFGPMNKSHRQRLANLYGPDQGKIMAEQLALMTPQQAMVVQEGFEIVKYFVLK